MSTVLVIEDNEDNLDMLSRRLGRKGFDVISAMDGEKGLDMARNDNPALILLDLDIPKIDGWQVARILKGEEATSSIPVIALTAFAMAGDREKALEAGCDDYASKPLDFKALVKTMEQYLSA